MSNYDSSNIKTSEYPEIVRMRPTMYTGQIGKAGNNHLAREIYDNSIDEAMNGYANEIIIEVSNKKSLCRVTDDGRGVPMDNGAGERIYTTLHSSGKYDKDSYMQSGGLNGVGASITVALSTVTKVKSIRDGYIWEQEYSKGKVKTKLKKKKTKSKKTGTVVEFKPDSEVMNTDQFNIDDIKEDVRMRSYLNKGLKITFIDLDTKEKETYFHKKGIEEYIENEVKDKVTPVISLNGYEEFGDNYAYIDIAMAYTTDFGEELLSFANSINTIEGGYHETGFKNGVGDAIRNYIDDNVTLTRSQKKLDLADGYRSGLSSIVSVILKEPQFSGQHKSRLGNEEINGIIRTMVREEFTKFLENNKKEAKIIVDRVILSADAKKAERDARNIRLSKGENELTVMSDLGKLSDCRSKDTSKNEIFIVEGE